MRRRAGGAAPPAGLGVLAATWNLGGCSPEPGAFRWPPRRRGGPPAADLVCVASQEAHYRAPVVPAGGRASALLARAAPAFGALAGAVAATACGGGGALGGVAAAAGFFLARYALAEARCRRHWLRTVESSLKLAGGDYELVAYRCLLHMRLAVFARRPAPSGGSGLRVLRVVSKKVPAGILGVWGNKGGLILRLHLAESGGDGGGECALNFIAAHLAPHEKPLDRRLRERGVMLRHILSASPGSGPRPSVEPMFLDARATVLLGDLNYRVVSKELPPGAVEEHRWDELLRHDQLSTEMAAGRLLRGFREGCLAFPPTYKLSGAYSYVANRTPSWCDRVLFFAPGGDERLEIGDYSSPAELVGPWDHRPVFATCRLPA